MHLFLRDITGIFQVSEKTIYKWIDKKGFPCVNVNEQFRFNFTDVLEWALECKIKLTPEILNFIEQKDGDHDILSGALKKGGIHYGIQGRNREDVLKTIVDLLPLPPDADRRSLFELFLARELMESTAIGNGIALPHIRNPIILNIQEPLVTLCFLKSAVDFHALDGKAVSILFTILSPSVKMHLSILSRLAFCLQNSNLQKYLHERASMEEIMAEFIILESRLGLSGKKKKTK